MVIRVSELCALRLAGARANIGNDSRIQLASPTASAVCSSRKVTMTPTRLYLFLLAVLMCGVVAAQSDDELHIPEENDNRYPPEYPQQKNMNSIDNSGTEVLEESKPTGVLEESVGPLEERVQAVEEPIQALEEPVQALEEPVNALEEPVGALEEPMGVLEEPAAEQEEYVGVLATPKALETPSKPAEALEEPARVLEEPEGRLDDSAGIPEKSEAVQAELVEVLKESLGEPEDPAGVLEEPVEVLDTPEEVQEESLGMIEDNAGVPKKPAVVPEDPVEVLNESMGVLGELEGVKEEPAGLIEEPVGQEEPLGLEEPVGLLETSEGVQDEPSGILEEPLGLEEPVGLLETPEGEQDEPFGILEEPAEVPEVPTGLSEDPAGAGVPEEPAGLPEEPAGVTEEPAGVPEALAGVPKDPTGVTEKPIIALEEPEKVLEVAVGVPKESPEVLEKSSGVTEVPVKVPEPAEVPAEELAGILEESADAQTEPKILEDSVGVLEEPAGISEEPAGISEEPAGLLTESVKLPELPLGELQEPTSALAEPEKLLEVTVGVPKESAGVLEESTGVTKVPVKVPEPAEVPAEELAGILEESADAKTEPNTLEDSVGVLEEPAGISEEPAGISEEPAGLSEEPVKVPELPLEELQEPTEVTEQLFETSTEAVQQKLDIQPTVHLNTMFKIEQPSDGGLLCPKPCVCNIEGNSDSFNVDCTGYELTEFPTPLDPRITSLNLQNNKLTTIPKELADLIKLKSLNVNNNSLTDIASGSVSQLSELEVLKLANNHLLEYPDDLKNGFGLTKLEELDLGGNDMRTELSSETFTIFQSLKHLTLPSTTPRFLEDLCVALQDNLEDVCTGTCDDKFFQCPYESTKNNEDDLVIAPSLDMIAFRSALDNVDTLLASNDGINSTPNVVHENEGPDNDLFPPTIIDNTLSSDVVSDSGIIKAPEITRSNVIVETPKPTTRYNESDVKVGATTSKGSGIDKSVIGIIVACMIVIVAAITIQKNWSSIRKRFSSNTRSATERAGRNGTNGTVPEEVPLQDKSPV